MKKRKTLLFAGFITALCVALSGCNVKEKTEVLQTQFTKVKQKISGAITSSASADMDTPDISILAKSIEEFVKKAEGTSAIGKEKEDMKVFFSLKNEAEGLEGQLNVYENQLEAQYMNGALTLVQLKEQESETRALGKMLVNAKSFLEIVFRMDC